MRLPSLCAFIACLLLVVPAGAQPASSGSSSSSKRKETTAPAAKPADTPPLNVCGCYEDSNGLCRCARKNRCGCPGECEPTGCEDKRRKEMDKEAQEELKRQRDEDKKRNAELTKKRDDEDKKEAQKRERSLRGLRLVEPK